MTAVCPFFTVSVVVAPRSVKSIVPSVPCGPEVMSEMVSSTSRRTSSDSSMCGVILSLGPILP